MVARKALARIAAAAAIAVLTLSASGCGIGAGAEAPSSSAPNSERSAEVKKLVDAMNVRPSTIPFLGPPITVPVPPGKTLYIVNCGAPSCVAVSEFITKVAATLGWETNNIKTDGSPEQITNAWAQVLRDKPTAAVAMGAAMSQIGKYVKQAAANGTAVVGMGTDAAAVGSVADQGLLADHQGPATLEQAGKALAQWIASDALHSDKGVGDAVLIDLSDVPVLKTIKEGFQSELSKYCPDCQSPILEIGSSNVQNAPDQVISYLRAHPSVKYVAIETLNLFNAVAPAVRAARLDVKIVGSFPSDTSLAQLRSGTLDAVLAAQDTEQALAAIDAVVRHVVGRDDEVAASVKSYVLLPWMLTKDNVPAENGFPIVADSLAQYEASWGK
jgi:hypothetical protein